MGPGDVYRVLIAAVCYGKARQTSESGQCWVCHRVLWVPGPRGQCSGKFRFIVKRRVQDERGRHVARSSSDPRKAYPAVKLQGWDLVQVVGIVALFAPLGVGTRGDFVFRAPGGKWAQEQRYATGEPGKLQSRDRVGIVEESCGYRARGVSIRGKFVLSRNMEYKTR